MSESNRVKTLALLIVIWLASAPIACADEFAKVQCGTDIPRALIGQRDGIYTVDGGL